MLPDALPQLIDMLLRLPRLEPAQLRKLIEDLPDPEASAQEMLRHGWITQEQFSSLFPGPQPTTRETVLVGFGDDDIPLDANSDNWDLTVSDEEMPSEPEMVDAIPALAANNPQFEWSLLVPPLAGGNEVRRRESDTDKLLRKWMGWSSKGLLLWILFVGSFFVGLQVFKAKFRVPPVASQASREAKMKTAQRGVTRPQITANKATAGDPAWTVGLPPEVQIAVNKAKQQYDLLNRMVQNGQPPAAKPKSTASLYSRLRQVVRENKTEETERLGIGDFTYQNVPDDGSIMVGMEVTYAPFFTRLIIKSVRPIYQKPDGTRYDGPVCGNPTQIGERVVAKPGHAIGAAAIKAGMGIDGMQLTFMEIGAEGLNPNKTYLSKWLGGYGGADARIFVNDGRPIVGVAGMRSRNPNGPAFCMCLVTTKSGALADADGQETIESELETMQRRQQEIMRIQR